MSKLLFTAAIVLLLAFQSSAQSIDSLKLSEKEIPQGYALTEKNNCISIQACLFYEKTAMYEVLIGKVKSKQIQSFDSKKDKGSIMYFEFERAFDGEGFLGGLLWGGNKPSSEHPEEFYAKGNILVIWSFKKDSPLKKVSTEKIKALFSNR